MMYDEYQDWVGELIGIIQQSDKRHTLVQLRSGWRLCRSEQVQRALRPWDEGEGGDHRGPLR
jgi:hypothetical protein